MGNHTAVLIFFSLCLALPMQLYADSPATAGNAIQPYKKNYLLLSTNEGSDDRCDAKIQLSFLTLLNALSLPENQSILGLRLRTPKKLNIGFNYTQTFFNDLCENSSPMVSTDYMPGLFLSFQETVKESGAEFKQLVFGWDHQSNGEFEGQTNRSWDRLYAEVLFGYNAKRDMQMHSQINPPPTSVNSFGRVGDDRVNLRIRFAHDWSVSDDNPDIADFYGMAEAEFSYTTTNTQTSLMVSGSEGYDRNFLRFELSTKYVPGLSHINSAINDKYQCLSNPSGFWTGVMCQVIRAPFALFDLRGVPGSWMLQLFDGYGERIRDYNVNTSHAFRFGYRFAS